MLPDDALFELFERALPDYALALLDRDDRIIRWSAGATHLMGYEPDAVQGRSLDFLCDPAEHQPPISECLRMAAAEGFLRVLRAGITRSGERVRAAVTIVSWPAGPVREGRLLWMAKEVSTEPLLQQALTQSEDRLQHLLGTAGVIPWERDPETRCFTYVGAQAAELLGFPLAEWYRPDFWVQRLHPEDRASTLSEYRVGIAAGAPQELEYRMIRADGKVVWVRELVAPSDPAASAGRIRGFMRDITQRRAIEAALAASERRLRAIVDAEPACVCLLSPEGEFREINASGRAVLGIPDPEPSLPGAPSMEAVPGNFLLEFVVPDHRQRVRAALERVLAGEPARILFQVFRRDHQKRWIELHARPFRDPTAGAGAIVGVARDVTEQHRLEARDRILLTLGSRLNAARTPEEAARATLLATRDLLGWDLGWLELWEASETGAHVSLCLEETDGVLLSSQPPLDTDAACAAAARTAAAGGDQGAVDGWPDSVLCAPIRSGDRTIGIIYLERRRSGSYAAEDARTLEALTAQCANALERTRSEAERLRFEQQFQQAQKMESVGRLAGGVAHDFNNVLAVINGYADLLLRHGNQEALRQKGLSEIRSAGQRAAELTAQLLAFSRKHVAEPRLLDVNTEVLNTETLLSRLIGENIRISLRLAPALPPVWANPGQLQQVLLNLAVNARDAMPLGGDLAIATRLVTGGSPAPDGTGASSGPSVELEVSDTGSGIPPEILPHIFEPFFTTKETGKGTGLGLSTAYGIVHQSGGSITVDSRPGVGSRFRIRLPAGQAGAASPDVRDVTVLTPGRGETVLLVEDEPGVRDLFHEILKSVGYVLLVAADAVAALELARAHAGAIHALVTDVVLPGMSGRELAEELERIHPEARVLFVSGYTADAVLRHGVATHETAFLQKPASPAELTFRIRTLLDG